MPAWKMSSILHAVPWPRKLTCRHCRPHPLVFSQFAPVWGQWEGVDLWQFCRGVDM